MATYMEPYTPPQVRESLNKIAEWKGEGSPPLSFVKQTMRLKEDIEFLFRELHDEGYRAKRKLAKAKAGKKEADKLRREFELYIRLTS
ncbi:hypothetical protein RvY_16471 [Ramazzottius varieornatus]|uniref:Uncharacterized protein n=1 Tax=Ramazzottius varieornatus TaxID=947166 RepID=A0A1D1VYK9_RAMVA|nr:hypothetical protein RvY_16471 [Ramazzottius varieornatus]